MAQEDILAQVLAEIYAKANPQPKSDNQQLNKIEIPNDQYAVSVNAQTWVAGTNLNSNVQDTMKIGQTVTTGTADPTTFRWGGVDSNGVLQYGGWDWGIGGAWG